MAASSVFIPPEWAPQRALWCGWPHLREEWGSAFEPARREIAELIRVASRFQPVRVACGSQEAEAAARAAVGPGAASVRFVRVPTGDIWLRDTGPIMAEQGTQLVALDFRFNGWGGKYIMPGDTETASAIAAKEGISVRQHAFVLEGGAIDMDGAGRLITTRQCLLNANRNPGCDESMVEEVLRTQLGVDEVVWLDQGLDHDHTDGHIDNLARFVGPGHVLCQTPSGREDVQSARLEAAEAQLRAAGLMVSTLPSPGRILNADGEDLPASHMNFTVINGAVLLPVYEAEFAPQAIARLQALFPRHEVIAVGAQAILSGGGSVHCMTREIPHIDHMVSGHIA